VLKLRWTPQLCSLFAIVNVDLPVRGCSFSGVAVNALSKERASTFDAENSDFDRHKDESFGEARAKRNAIIVPRSECVN